MIAKMKSVLLVDDDVDFVWLTSRLLKEAGYQVLEAYNGEESLNRFLRETPDLVVMDYRLPGRDGLAVSLQMIRACPGIPIVIISGFAEIRMAIRALKAGVYDYVTKPLDPDDFLFTIKRALEKRALEQEVKALKRMLHSRAPLYERMGPSSAVKRLVEHVEKVAATDFKVLIQGESGTGKELVAGAIHELSAYREGPFVAVDCGAIPETLIESELFGYCKGAFTGAHKDKEGHFETANGGTLFLDEVGNLHYWVQQKLLRAIQEQKIQRLGGGEPIPVSTRIVAASNQALEKDVKAGRFRSDLYFRLTEFKITVPPLRDRKKDIPYLAARFEEEVEKELGKQCGGLSTETLQVLMSHAWPGNVRELRNTIRQSVLLCEKNRRITPAHLTFSEHHREERTLEKEREQFFSYDSGESLQKTVNRIRSQTEKQAIETTLTMTKWNKSETARRLCIDYKTLLRKMRKYDIVLEEMSS